METQLKNNDQSLITGNHVKIRDSFLENANNLKRYNRYGKLARMNHRRGKILHAQRCLEKGVSIAIKLGGRNSHLVLNDLEMLAILLLKQGKKEACKALILRTQRARFKH